MLIVGFCRSGIWINGNFIFFFMSIVLGSVEFISIGTLVVFIYIGLGIIHLSFVFDLVFN